MTIELLAQATYPTENVPRWLIVFAAALGFIIVIILPLLGVLIAWVLSQRKNIADALQFARDATVNAAQAKTAAYANTGHVSDVSRKSDVQFASLNQQVNDIALAVNKTNGSTPPAPPAPTPEAIQAATAAAADSPEKPSC